MTNEDDSELAARAQNGDRSAFGELLERHYDTAYRVAVRFTGNLADGEDIAQDVCLSLVTKLRTFRGDSKFSTWLYSVVVNACRDHLRKRKSAESLQSSYAVFREMDAADQADDAERLGWLSAAVAALEPRLRETAILVLSENLKHREAAEVLGCAETTVSWRMGEVSKKLKSLAESADDQG
jgi:RNA polymerase sigma-70 factor (ECF subfamily)